MREDLLHLPPAHPQVGTSVCNGPEEERECPAAGPVCGSPCEGAYVSACCCEPLLYTCITLFIVIFQEDFQQEEDGPAGEQQPEDDFLVGNDADDRFEPLEAGTLQEGRTFLCFRKKYNRAICNYDY